LFDIIRRSPWTLDSADKSCPILRKELEDS
jgi:hypothetical protein